MISGYCADGPTDRALSNSRRCRASALPPVGLTDPMRQQQATDAR
jgi:hypothetical protein